MSATGPCIRSFVVASLALATAGCGVSMFGNTSGYDSQGCAEDALRKSPPEDFANSAAVEFELACRAGDPGACSALGVTYELGLGKKTNVGAARTLYGRACKAGNQRGCVNLAKLDLALDRSSDGKASRALLESACTAGETSGCAALGRIHSRQGRDKDVFKAIQLLEPACEKNAFEACFDLGEIERASATADPAKSLGLYVKACIGGHEPACVRAGMPTQKPAPQLASR